MESTYSKKYILFSLISTVRDSSQRGYESTLFSFEVVFNENPALFVRSIPATYVQSISSKAAQSLCLIDSKELYCCWVITDMDEPCTDMHWAPALLINTFIFCASYVARKHALMRIHIPEQGLTLSLENALSFFFPVCLLQDWGTAVSGGRGQR